MRKLNSYSDCMRSCGSCEVSGLGDPTIAAVNQVCDEFGPDAEDRRDAPDRNREDYEDTMMGPVLAAIEDNGAPLEHAPAVMAAAGIILTRHCTTSLRFAEV